MPKISVVYFDRISLCQNVGEPTWKKLLLPKIGELSINKKNDYNGLLSL